MTIQQAFEAALQHHQSGRLAQAEALYRQVLAADPRHADALHLLGVIAHQLGRDEVALKLISQAIVQTPSVPHFYSNLGETYRALRQLDEAIASYRQAIALRSDYPEAHYNLGNTLRDKGQLDEAIASYRQAIAFRPDYPEAYGNLGVALYDKGQVDEAIDAFRRAIAIRPAYPEAHNNLGNALREKIRLDEAIAACRQAIALRPDYPDAHSNLGNALREKGQVKEAIAAYRKAIALQPKLPEAHSNLGVALDDVGQVDEAIAAYRRAIALQPDYPEAHNNLSLALLLQGNFIEGWEEHEWRWKTKGFPSPLRNFAQPQWDGSPLEGRTLLLHAEQGLGDALQFARYLPLIEGRGGHVVFECQPELQRLLGIAAPDLSVVPRGRTLPAFDVHCPLLSLPRLLGTDLSNIPQNVPYLRADAADARRWRERLDDQSSSFNVGLVWAGNPVHKNDRKRSLKLASLLPLGQVPGVRFFSLQKGEPALESKTPPPGMEWFDFTGELKDFADTAALVAALDLVISVDTAVVHLAGAMGKPVWTLLPFAPDWRWLLARKDTPWYPTMRLFRQVTMGDWETVTEDVREQLRLLVQSERRKS